MAGQNGWDEGSEARWRVSDARWRETLLLYEGKQYDDYADLVFHREVLPRITFLNWMRQARVAAEICLSELWRKKRKLLVVDVGCGRGESFHQLYRFTRHYIGLDPNPGNLQFWESGKRVQFVAARGEEIPLAGDVADVVLLLSVLDHSRAPQQIFHEARRVLRSDGMLILSFGNARSWLAWLRKRLRGPSRHRDEEHTFHFTPDAVEDLLRRARFRVQKRQAFDYLRLPRWLDRRLPPGLLSFLSNLGNALGGRLAPSYGDSLWIAARPRD